MTAIDSRLLSHFFTTWGHTQKVIAALFFKMSVTSLFGHFDYSSFVDNKKINPKIWFSNLGAPEMNHFPPPFTDEIIRLLIDGLLIVFLLFVINTSLKMLVYSKHSNWGCWSWWFIQLLIPFFYTTRWTFCYLTLAFTLYFLPISVHFQYD